MTPKAIRPASDSANFSRHAVLPAASHDYQGFKQHKTKPMTLDTTTLRGITESLPADEFITYTG
ncbi:hypothetical protein [Arsenophonus nasoniae]|uniref:Uncharacterized protein n=1 Tax=Arsenophonus nasoniae TaxID=638 RepID=A0A4P7LB91_9GAMM|nr:hypothetical protein [Arsenophonus nasoniae]QBY46392.1 hypothetical protein ArsFIN_50030 [Arsenophonus nasoniae]